MFHLPARALKLFHILSIALVYLAIFESVCASPVAPSSSTPESLQAGSDAVANEYSESAVPEYPDGFYQISEDGGGPVLIEAIPSDFDPANLNLTDLEPSSRLSPFPNPIVSCEPDANLGSIHLDAESYHHLIMRGLVYQFWNGNHYIGRASEIIMFNKIMLFFCNMKDPMQCNCGEPPRASNYMPVNDLLEQRCGSRIPGSVAVRDREYRFVYGRMVQPPPRFMPIVASFRNLCEERYYKH